MLYISRCIWPNKYGVVDTDDNTEAVICDNDLHAVCSQYEFPVAGVVVDKDRWIPCIDRVFAYQPVETWSQFQLKTQVLMGVEVHVFGDAIVGIRWNPDNIKSPVRIRLSDFGVHCQEFMLAGNRMSHGHKVTLVFDDKVDFNSGTFSVLPYDFYRVNMSDIGLAVDLSEMTNEASIRNIYQLLYTMSGSMDEMKAMIIDLPARKDTFYDWMWHNQPLPF